jgi:hypothetical protein
MNKESSDNLNTILAGALILIAVFIFTAMIMIRSQATGTTSTTLSVNNVPPVVTNVTVSQYQNSNTVTLGGDTGLIVNPASIAPITVSGIISDDNLATDISGYHVYLLRNNSMPVCTAALDQVSTRTNLNQGADYNNCYFNTTDTSEGGTCTLGAPGAGLSRSFTCDVNINYNADSTDGKRTSGPAASGAQFGEDSWTLIIIAMDLSQAISFEGPDFNGSNYAEFDVDPQVSLTIPGSIDYGAVEVGGISSAYTMTHMQQANQIGDTQVYAYNQMNCQANVSTANPPVGDGSTGSIPFSNQRWALTAAAAIDPANSTQFSNTSTHTNVDVGYAESSNDNANITGGTGTVAFAMHNLPAGVRGFCYGEVTITHSPVN